MNLIILGASGKTGRQLVRKALERGHRVTAFVRSPDKLAATEGVTVVTGDARNQADLVKALQGQDAVVSALGSMKAGDRLAVQSAEALIAAAGQTGVSRIVMMSTFLLLPNFKPNLMMKLIGGLLKGVLNDKSSGEDLLKRSDLDWTVVYATPLDKAAPGGAVRIVPDNETVGMGNGIARADVADFMLKTLESPESPHRSYLITVK